MSQQQYGLVLSGGGAKGAFEMGVWKALRECDYSLGAVIGTSVGALNAAMIAQDDYEMAMAFWSNLTINQVLDLNKKITNTYVEQWSKENFDVFRDGFLTILFSDGLDISPLRHNLTQLICEEKIRNSPIRFGLVTVDITSLKPCQLMIEDIPEGQLIDYLLASAALPIFQKQEIDGKTYLDGGFLIMFRLILCWLKILIRLFQSNFQLPGCGNGSGIKMPTSLRLIIPNILAVFSVLIPTKSNRTFNWGISMP